MENRNKQDHPKERMDSTRKFILKKGTRLYSISYLSPNNGVLQNLYFVDSGQALMSIFLWPDNGRYANFELNIYTLSAILYFNVYVLQENILITPAQRGGDFTLNLLRGNPTLPALKRAIGADCTLEDSDGFVLPYESRVLFLNKRQRPLDPNEVQPGMEYDPHGLLIGRSTAYVICREDLLNHVQSFIIDHTILFEALTAFADEWAGKGYEGPRPLSSTFRPEVRSYTKHGNLTVEVLANYLREYVRDDPEPILVRANINPLANLPAGLRSPGMSPIAARPSSPFAGSLSPTYVPLPPPPTVFAQSGERVSPSKPLPGQADPFGNVPSDVLRFTALNMDLTAIINACRVSRRFNRLLCANEVFWVEKVRTDFPGAKVPVDPGNPQSRLAVDPDSPLNPENRKPEGWSWRTYYRELTGKIEEENALVFANLDTATLEQIKNLPEAAKRERINEMRRAAGLGAIVFPPLPISPDRPPVVHRYAFPDDDIIDAQLARAGDEADVVIRGDVNNLAGAHLQGWPEEIHPRIFLDAAEAVEDFDDEDDNAREADNQLQILFNTIDEHAYLAGTVRTAELDRELELLDRLFPDLAQYLNRQDRAYLRRRLILTIMEEAHDFGYIDPIDLDINDREDAEQLAQLGDSFLMGALDEQGLDIDRRNYEQAWLDTNNFYQAQLLRQHIHGIPWLIFPTLDDMTPAHRQLFAETMAAALRYRKSFMETLYTQSHLFHERLPAVFNHPPHTVETTRRFLARRMLAPLLVQEAERQGFVRQERADRGILDANLYLYRRNLIPEANIQEARRPGFQGVAGGLVPLPGQQQVQYPPAIPYPAGYQLPPQPYYPPPQAPAGFLPNVDPMVLANLIESIYNSQNRGLDIQALAIDPVEQNLYEAVIASAAQNVRNMEEEFTLLLRNFEAQYPQLTIHALPPVVQALRARFRQYIVERNPFTRRLAAPAQQVPRY